LAETAKSRAPESVPLSPARRALAEASEEVSAAQAAFDVASQKRSDADAALSIATQKVDNAISRLFARDLPQRIANAQRLHDEFLAQCLSLDELCPDISELPERVGGELRLLRSIRQSMSHFDYKAVYGRAQAWKAARQALRDDCNAALPSD